MFSFDKLALLIVSLICLACAMYLAQAATPTSGQATLMGGLVAFLTSAQTVFFSILKAEALAQRQQAAVPAPSVPAIVAAAATSAPPTEGAPGIAIPTA